jgi:hypothetical protein
MTVRSLGFCNPPEAASASTYMQTRSLVKNPERVATEKAHEPHDVRVQDMHAARQPLQKRH